MPSVLFLCTGNICRSPTAHWVMQKIVEDAKLEVKVDSAGTHAYHIGEGADKRSSQTAKTRGYDLSQHKARKLDYADFYEYDYILCMDKGHYTHAMALKLPNSKAEVAMFANANVPDPYYGGQKGFDNVLTMIEEGCQQWLLKITQQNLRAG